jgi:hypothetical protein
MICLINQLLEGRSVGNHYTYASFDGAWLVAIQILNMFIIM